MRSEKIEDARERYSHHQKLDRVGKHECPIHHGLVVSERLRHGEYLDHVAIVQLLGDRLAHDLEILARLEKDIEVTHPPAAPQGGKVLTVKEHCPLIAAV